ncbi:acetyl-CoA carboxylase biotin carboxyl carrier protein subunit [Dictyobacter arantiisoli]|uniref:Lipoyl-binding domain-containing protein n=1 Tax=Dictyobacter arantiisoli TaxID=2014874 RepID=A0A5A5TG13_9CHLR|nr:acetyl-CoA carboxylase biotin carboxyl carrier protein subunit [Dictyobacter arantiisoli]GCF10198.1 hypothetical protein KDI_37620 [Dictyobacter arantiisoli]
MSYITTVDHYQYQITTQQQGNQTLATLDGVSEAIDWKRIAPLSADDRGKVQAGGRYSLLLQGKSYEILARHLPQLDEKGTRTYEIQLAGQYFMVAVEDERTHLLEGIARTNVHTSAATVRAPMPGLVVNTLVTPGDKVRAGETVVILEAMKMENDLSAPLAGIVKELKVQAGQTVDQGQALVIIESQADGEPENTILL